MAEKKVAGTAEDAKVKDTAKAKKDVKAKSSGKPKKPSIFARMAKYFRDVAGEFKKVVWPTRKQVLNNCIVVLVTIVVFAVVVWGLDYLLAWLRELIYSGFTPAA